MGEVGWPREQYANIAGAESAQVVLHNPKSSNTQAVLHQSLPLIPNHFTGSVGGPEKAVGHEIGRSAGFPGVSGSQLLTCGESRRFYEANARTKNSHHWSEKLAGQYLAIPERCKGSAERQVSLVRTKQLEKAETFSGDGSGFLLTDAALGPWSTTVVSV